MFSFGGVWLKVMTPDPAADQLFPPKSRAGGGANRKGGVELGAEPIEKGRWSQERLKEVKLELRSNHM